MGEILRNRRKTGEPIKYTTEEMSQLTKTQNEFIYIELWHVFKMDVAPKLNHKLEGFSRDAYDAVAHKMLNETRKQPTYVGTEPTTTDACNSAGGCDNGRQEGAMALLPQPTHWTISAQPTAFEPPVATDRERRAGEGEVRPYLHLAHGGELCAGGDGGGRSCAFAPALGSSGGCGSKIGPRGILVGQTASDQEGGGRQVRGKTIPPSRCSCYCTGCG